MEEPIKQGIKFYIYEGKYYLYEVSKSRDKSYYLYNLDEEIKTDINIPIDNTGEMLIKYFNNYYNVVFNVINEFFSSDTTNLDDLCKKILIQVQQQINYFWAKLLVNEVTSYINGRYAPKYYIKLYEATMKKLDLIAKLSKDKSVIDKFNFKKMLEIDIDNFLTEDKMYKLDEDSNVKDEVNEILSLMLETKKIDKLFFEHLLNNKKINILDLTLSNSITNIKYEILPNTNKNIPYTFIEAYTIDDLTTFLLFEMLQIQKNDICIKKCELCGKYFIPKKDRRQKYCDNIYKENKTCSEVAFNETTMKNPIYATYRKSYKAQHNKMISNLHVNAKVKGKWEIYSKDLKAQYEKCNNNEISLKEFTEWIEQHKNWITE